MYVRFFRTSRSRSAGFPFCATYLITVIAVIAAHDSGAISFVDGGCAQAASGGAEVVQGRRRRGAEAAARGRWRGGLPAASAHPLIG